MSISLFNQLGKRDEVIGKYDIRKPSFFRRLTIDGLDAIPLSHNMMALLEFDVTESRKVLREQKKNGKRVSLFAFIIKSIATALTEYKELNSAGEKFPRQIVIRNAAEKTVEEIFKEINTAKKQYQKVGDTGQEDKWALRLMRKLFILPKFIRTIILKSFINNPFTVKKMSGTTFITSVSTFGKNPGFVIPYLGGPRAVSFALGSVVKKPAVVGQEILIREFLSMTVFFNHDIVDGAPAARFTNRLKKLIENADVL